MALSLSLSLSLSLFVLSAFKVANFYIIFTITRAGVVPCGDPKKSPRTLSLVPIIFYYWFLRSAGIFREIRVFRNKLQYSLRFRSRFAIIYVPEIDSHV